MEALYASYGRPTDHDDDDEGDDILATLVATILSQSTNDSNSSRAFGSLVDTFEGDWHRIAHTPIDEVAESIVAGGLSNQKAPRIQAALRQIERDFGAYSLDALRDWDLERAKAYLLALRGVGPKTAAFVLMRAARMPLFAMDTHIMRICSRLGWIASSTSSAAAHARMRKEIPDGEHDPFHVVMIRHGRHLCHPRRPECARCPLLKMCPHGIGQVDASS